MEEDGDSGGTYYLALLALDGFPVRIVGGVPLPKWTDNPSECESERKGVRCGWRNNVSKMHKFNNNRKVVIIRKADMYRHPPLVLWSSARENQNRPIQSVSTRKTAPFEELFF
jgi:hypothetical protein